MDAYPHASRRLIEKGSALGANLTGLPSEHEIELSKAISLKRIADALDSSDDGGRPQGSVLWWLETIASAANAGRS